MTEPNAGARRHDPARMAMIAARGWTPERRAAWSARMRATWSDPDQKAARVAAIRETCLGPVGKARQARAAAAAWSPERRASRAAPPLPAMTRAERLLYQKMRRAGISRADALAAIGIAE